MAASSPRSLMVAPSPQPLPQIVEALVGGVLELVIHSIESLRDRRDKLSLR